MKPKVQELEQNVHKIEYGDGKILYLIGTAHVSSSSVTLVEKYIMEIRPDTVTIELDEQRRKAMMKKTIYEDIDIFEIIKSRQFFFFIGQFVLSAYQKKISQKTGVKPGEEFRKAIEKADEIGADIVLADRNVGTTLKRAWRLTRFLDKMKFLGSMLVSDDEDIDDIDIEKMKSMDAIDNLIKSFEDELPDAKRVLIDERDMYLSSEIDENLGDVTVAVVGAGHVPGILAMLGSPLAPEKKMEISEIPPPSKIGKILPWLIPALIAAAFILGFIFGRREVAADVAVFWVLANGILTALGCIIALGHPLTVIAGFIAAPITSLNPTIGAGFVTALVQTFLVRPRVSDFEQIHNREFKFMDIWRNRLAKIIMVFFLSSIGSTIGTFVALPALMRFFGGN